eukprot:836850_1
MPVVLIMELLFTLILVLIYADADDTKRITPITNAKIIPVTVAVSAACTAINGPIDTVTSSDNAQIQSIMMLPLLIYQIYMILFDFLNVHDIIQPFNYVSVPTITRPFTLYI